MPAMAWIIRMGVPPALYAAAVVLLMQHALNESIELGAIGGAGLLGASIYLLHRTGGRPPSTATLRGALVVAVCAAIASAITLGMHDPWAPMLVVGALAGIGAYGRGPWPLRRVATCKPLCVAAAITALALALSSARLDAVTGITAAALLAVVVADALLCDLADVDHDRAASVRTLVMTLGGRRTWMVAIVLHAIAAPALAACGQATIGWLLLATLPLPWLLGGDLRTIVDLRLGLVAVLAIMAPW